MKQLISSIIIIIMIITLGNSFVNMLRNESEKLYEVFTELENTIISGSWDKAEKTEKALKAKWEKYKKSWPMFIDHLEIDNITVLLAELKSYIVNKDKKEALSRLAILKVLIRHIPERESFTIQNIL